MQRTQLAENYSVSDQITVDDVDTLVDAGVDLIICNRPDNESEQQPAFAEIAARAADRGIAAVNIPFVGGEMNATHVDLLREQLAKAKIVHAYCRTGNRSTTIWQACQQSEQEEGALGMENVGQTDSGPTYSIKEKPGQKTEGKSVADSSATPQFDVVIVGAGSAGITTAAGLLKRKSSLRICLVDPAEDHYYQPGWTMVGSGVFDARTTRRPMIEVIPDGVTWLKNAVAGFDPDNNQIRLDDDTLVYYNILVVAAGLELNWKAIEGLAQTLGDNGVTSNYRFDLAPYTWKLVQSLRQGKAIFTQPPMPIKCAGAPQKAMYLSCDHWLRQGVLPNIDVQFCNAGGVLFGVPDYVPALQEYVEKYQANLNFNCNLKKIDGPNRVAWFGEQDEQGNEVVSEREFDMIHVCPPQRAPEFVRQSPLADDAGWVDVDQATLRHKKYDNIWGLGDVTNTPNAKTMAAARKQAPVVAHNICRALDSKGSNAVYDGYGSCPLTVERGKIVLAEFGYGGKLLPTFPDWFNDGTKATRFAWILKQIILPPFYWHGMLKGREWFVKPKTK